MKAAGASGRRRVWLAALALALGAPVGAAAEAKAIPPGQEPLVARMVGGEALPAGCRAERIDIAPDRIDAAFRCDAGEARLRLVHPDGAPAGALRTARFAVVPVGAVPPGLADAVAAGVRRHEDRFLWHEAGAEGAPRAEAAGESPPFPWLVAAAAVLAATGLFGSPRPGARDLGVALAVAAAAAGLRLALGPWGPLRVNGLGPLWIDAAAGTGSAAAYGPGYPEVFGPVAALWPAAPDTAIFAANAVLSGVIPALAFGLGRLAGLDRPVALAAAVLLAADPVALRIGATESYHTPIAAAALASSLLFLAAARTPSEAGRWPAACLAVAATLLAAQAARIHPVALAPALLAPVALLALAGEEGWRRSWLAAGIGVAAVALVSAGAIQRAAAVGSGTVMQPHLHASSLAVAAAAGLALSAAGLWARRPLLLAAAAHVAAALATSSNFLQSWVWHQAYLRLFLAVPLLAAASLLPRALALPLAGVASAALLAAGWPAVRARTTDHLEYRWVRAQGASIPDECVVAWVSLAGDRFLALPVRRPLQLAAGEALPARFLDGRCLWYLRGSLCTSAEGRLPCQELERSLALEPVSRATFPAAPSADHLPYDRPAVECALFRVRGPASGSAAPP